MARFRLTRPKSILPYSITATVAFNLHLSSIRKWGNYSKMVFNRRVRNRTLHSAAVVIVGWTILSICLSMLYITDGFTGIKYSRHFVATRTDEVPLINGEAVSERYTIIYYTSSYSVHVSTNMSNMTFCGN